MIRKFEWPHPGEDWWAIMGSACGATMRQINFVAARVSGRSVAEAAEIARYPTVEEAERASRSAAVRRLYQMHAREAVRTHEH